MDPVTARVGRSMTRISALSFTSAYSVVAPGAAASPFTRGEPRGTVAWISPVAGSTAETPFPSPLPFVVRDVEEVVTHAVGRPFPLRCARGPSPGAFNAP